MGDDIRITVIATGFERTGMPRRITTSRPASHMEARPVSTRQMEYVSVEAQNGQSSNVEFRPQTFNTEDLDIPTFLRNRR